MKVDWAKLRANLEADCARYAAMPLPTENTIEACAEALKAAGYPHTSVSGVLMTIDEMVADGRWSLEDWRSMLQDWRFLHNELD